MIQVENVSRRYGDFVAVGDVSFSIGQGEIVGLLGHNGAGKTTIMKMLTGYLEPTSGHISINGMDVETDSETVQNSLGYLPENLPVYPEMSVIDYLFYCAQVRNLPENQQESAVKEAIQKTELQEKAFSAIDTLSRGFKQRVGVAQALIHNPKLLILDEPTNGLDPHQTAQMRRLITNLASDATVILSTHIMQEVDAVCNRVLILDGGKLAVDEPMDNLRRSDTLLVETTADEKSFAKILNDTSFSKLKASQSTEQSFCYHLPIKLDNDIKALSAHITEQLVKNNEKVFSVHPLQRDLETVFREVHAKNNQEVTDAA